MIQLVFTPPWFYGKDILIDIISIIVLLMIAFFSLRYYRIDRKNSNYLFLSASFFLIAVSFIFKILTNFTIYYHALDGDKFDFIIFTHSVAKTSGTFFYLGFFFYRLLTLLGLSALYSIYQKELPKGNIFLVLYLMVMLTYFSQGTYYVFHLTSLILMSLIAMQFYRNYRLNKSRTAKLLVISFVVITISQLVFIFIKLAPMLYVAAEFIQLCGYIMLLFTFIKVLSNAKKT